MQNNHFMKKLFFSFILLFLAFNSDAQMQNPVKWNFTATKKAEKVYEVIITAMLPKPWHIYSQNTPQGGPVPTSFSFKANPLVSLKGSPKEIGKLKTDHDENFGIDVKYYADRVEFVQTVNLKANVKTNLSGAVQYMVCNDEKCLPPTKVSFDLKLQ